MHGLSMYVTRAQGVGRSRPVALALIAVQVPSAALAFTHICRIETKSMVVHLNQACPADIQESHAVRWSEGHGTSAGAIAPRTPRMSGETLILTLIDL